MRRNLQNIGLCSIDDPLFPEGGTGGGGGNGAEPPKPPANGDDPTPAAGISMAEAAELFTQGNAPLVAQIEALSEATTKLAQNANQPAPVTPDPAGNEDFLTQFSTDPEKAVKDLMRGEMAVLAPMMGNLMNSGSSAFIGIEAQAVDQEFGSGAWSELFEKPITAIMDSYRTSNPAALADRNTITREVNMLKGQLISKLVEHQAKSAKVTEEATAADRKALTDTITEDVTQRTGMTGGIRRHEAGAMVITEDIKGYVEERQRAIGGNEDAKTFMERTDYGNTLEDYLAHQKKSKEEK